MLGKVRWIESDPTNQEMEAIQKCMNKLLRILNNTSLRDMISTKFMLTKFKLLSVNQINAQIKLTEAWKSINVAKYPIQTTPLQRSEDARSTRALTNGMLLEAKTTISSDKTFLNNTIHIWNRAPIEIKNCSSLYSVKKAIKAFVVTLPV